MLSPELMQRLAPLSLRTLRRRAANNPGQRRSPRRGRSQEFADHRPYTPGDDLRFLDWPLLARLDEPWIKQFEEEQDRTVHPFIDASGSMDGPKLELARGIAAGLAFVGLGGAERVGVAALTETLVHYAAPRRGRSHLPHLLRCLARLDAQGGSQPLRGLQRLPPQRGAALGFVLSDLYWPEGVEAPLRRLLAHGHELHVLHLLTPEDLEPDLSGDLLLTDSETEDQVGMTIDDLALERYQAALDAWLGETAEACARLGVGYCRITTDRALEDVLLHDLRRAQVLGRASAG